MPRRHSYKAASLGGTPSWPFDASANGVRPQDAEKVLAIVAKAAAAIRDLAPAGVPSGRGGACRPLAIRVFAASLEHVAERWADKRRRRRCTAPRDGSYPSWMNLASS